MSYTTSAKTTIHVSCTASQKQEIQSTARRAYPHLQNATSRYILNILLQTNNTYVHRFSSDNVKLLGAYLIQLQGIARNINQQTRKLNAHDEKIDLQTQKEQIVDLIQHIKRLIPAH